MWPMGAWMGYWEFKLKPWDVAAGILILEEAGGIASQMDGAAIQLTPYLNLVAANPELHAKMLEVLGLTLPA